MRENNILTRELDDDDILPLVLNDSRRRSVLCEAMLRNLGAALAEAQTPLLRGPLFWQQGNLRFALATTSRK